MARGNWDPNVIKPSPRCRLCRRVVREKDMVRLDGIYPAHQACADAAGRTYTVGAEVHPAEATLEARMTDKPAAEVTNVAAHGFWLRLGEKELFLSYAEFPWFRQAAVEQICKVECKTPSHLYWPELDVDLSLESIRNPERYPLTTRLHALMAEMPAGLPCVEGWDEMPDVGLERVANKPS